MNKAVFIRPWKICLQTILLLAISCFNLSAGNVNTAHAANAPATTDSCGQLLADAQAKFLSLLPADGSIPATPEVRAAATEYIRVSKLCYNEIQANQSSATLQTGTPTFIDDGGMVPGNNTASANFVAEGQKWNSNTITYSFMPSGISFSSEKYGNSVAVSQLNGFKTCFYTRIQNAFAAWQAIANVRFVQVTDNGAAFDAAGATGDIRIAAHAFDGKYGILAHAYFPAPNGPSEAGDLHFDSAEPWACDTSDSSKIDIGLVALHEIGHSLGLDHQNAPPTAVMNPTYNPSLTSLQPDDINGVRSIYGAAAVSAPPANDNFANATQINSLTYNQTLDTKAATTAGTDPASMGPCDARTMDQGQKSVWYKYQPSVPESIAVDTVSTNYDTVLAVWTGSEGSLSLVKCDDDDLNGLTSSLSFNGSAGTFYYIEVMQYHCTIPCPGNSDPPTGGTLQFHVNITNTDVYIGANKQKSYYVSSTPTTSDSYPSIVNGPLKVISSTGANIFASQQAIYGNSFNELMGYPANKFSTEYWFPWYDQVYMRTWILVGNPSTTQTAYVDIYIAGARRSDTTGAVKTYSIAPGQNITPQFPGMVNGPVRVVSVTGTGTPTPINIFASERSLYGVSFNEVMGYPVEQFTTEYWFPWYDQVNMSSWLLVGNPSTTETAYVDIYIGGVKRADTTHAVQTYAIPPGQNITPQFPGIVDGAVQVVSVTGTGTPTPVNIFTSERSLYGTSFNEVMGYPTDQLTSDYYFPWYDNHNMTTWVLVGNPSTTQKAYVDIYIGGAKRADTTGVVKTYTIDPGQNVTPQFTFVSGPVHVVSVTGSGTPTPLSVFTSERVIYKTSFNEMMGYPANQLTSEYWFTWYDNLNMKTSILVGTP